METIRFFHLHSGRRHITVGRVLDAESKTIKFAYSVCNPKDQFDRKLGREIVEKRLEKNKNVFYTSLHSKPMWTVINCLANRLKYEPPVPTCVQKMAKEWLAVHGPKEDI